MTKIDVWTLYTNLGDLNKLYLLTSDEVLEPIKIGY